MVSPAVQDEKDRGEIERTGRELVFARRWSEAIELYEELSRTGRDFGWLVERLSWRQSRAEEYRQLFGNAAHKKRITEHFREARGLTVEVVDTAPAKVGFIGVAGFVHTLDTGDAGTFKIYEKVFGAPDAEKVKHEAELFALYTADALKAPEFYGTQTAGEFISAYYAFVDAVPFAPGEWSRLQKELIQDFWLLQPAGGFSPQASIYPAILDVVDQLESFSIFREMEQGADRFCELAASVRRNRALIASTIAQMPKFPLHRDLHADNVLRDSRGRVLVIDWEKWSFEPIGFGWAQELSPRYKLPKPGFAKLMQSRELFAGFNVYHLLMLSSLWGLRNAVVKKTAGGLAWLERLADCCERAALLHSQGQTGLDDLDDDESGEFEALYADAPKLRASGVETFEGDALRALKDTIDTSLDRKAWRIAETGAGNTTVLFLLMQPNHLHSISAEHGIRDRIVAYCEAHTIATTALDFRHDRSELVLPDLAAQLRTEQRKLDVALMGGLRGWPTVFVEFCYFHAMLRTGGLLIVTDVQLYSVAEFVRWLSEQPEYVLVKQIGQTMAFRKLVSSAHFKDFAAQPYMVRKNDVGSSSNDG